MSSRAWLNTFCSSQTNKDHLMIEKALSELSYMKPSDPLFEDKMDSIIEVWNLVTINLQKKKASSLLTRWVVDVCVCVWMCFKNKHVLQTGSTGSLLWWGRSTVRGAAQAHRPRWAQEDELQDWASTQIRAHQTPRMCRISLHIRFLSLSLSLSLSYWLGCQTKESWRSYIILFIVRSCMNVLCVCVCVLHYCQPHMPKTGLLGKWANRLAANLDAIADAVTTRVSIQ